MKSYFEYYVSRATVGIILQARVSDPAEALYFVKKCRMIGEGMREAGRETSRLARESNPNGLEFRVRSDYLTERD